jgi:hypothetical protein
VAQNKMTNKAFMIIKQVFSPEEIDCLLKDITLYESQALEIHGNRTMLKLQTVFAKEYVQNLFDKVKKRMPLECEKGIDCSVVFTKPGSVCQDWHLDSLQNFPVINILLNSNITTEFLDIDYVPNFTAGILQYPACWTASPKNILQPDVQSGDGIYFPSNSIHRGPALNKSDSTTRICLFLSFSTKNERGPTTDYVYSNWEWLDCCFGYNDFEQIRSWKHIDFLITNPSLLDLYPKNVETINGTISVRQSIVDQMIDRKDFIKNYPDSLYIYDIVDVLGIHRFVSVIRHRRKSITLYFYKQNQDKEGSNFSVEQTLDFDTFLELKPVKITKRNMWTFSGYMFKKIQSTMIKKECPIIVYPFSHRLAISELDSTTIPLQINASRKEPIFVHPLLHYTNI